MSIDRSAAIAVGIPHIVPVLIPDDAEIGWNFANLTGDQTGALHYPGTIMAVTINRGPRQ